MLEKQPRIEVNATSKNPTHFLRAVELIYRAREKFMVPSENWPYPTTYRLGTPCERYYAEIWTDGMDWQPSYWVIEEKNLEKPQVYPFIIFKSNEDRSKFNDYDFEQLVIGSLWYRRDLYWVKQNDSSIYNDISWPYLHDLHVVKKYNLSFKHLCMKKFYFEHASQPTVNFLMNIDFVRKDCICRSYPKQNLRGCLMT